MKARVFALLIAALPLGGFAQVCGPLPATPDPAGCEPSETPSACSARLIGPPGMTPEETKEAEKTGEKILALKNTGDTGSASINDFLPLLRILLDTGAGGEDDGKLGVSWSNPLTFVGDEFQHKVSVVLQRSELFEPLKAAMTAASLDDDIETLEDNISEADDITFDLSFGPSSERFGRDPRQHQVLLSAILRGVDLVEPAVQSKREKVAIFEVDHIADVNPTNVPFCAIARKIQPSDAGDKEEEKQKKDDTLRKDYREMTTALLLAERASLRDFAGRLRKSGFYSALDLVSNQEQLTGSLTYRERDESVGPDEFKATVSYEFGGPNLYKFEKKTNCTGMTQTACFTKYLEDNAKKIRSAQRLRVNAEYTKLSRVEFALPAPGFSYVAEPVERLAITGTYGRYLGDERPGQRRARLDVSVSYEDFSDDPLRQDRGLASVAVTYPFIEGFYLSLGAVYATKPEFRGDVDAELSARAGFTYKILEDK